MRTDDIIRNADAKNPSESDISNPIANARVGNPNAADTVDAVNQTFAQFTDISCHVFVFSKCKSEAREITWTAKLFP
uniref:SFRICE_014921 n=1 Tax=Spodoptera frugiperda TaxID=7108 RepID=A0A2H1VVX8_SPOFR